MKKAVNNPTLYGLLNVSYTGVKNILGEDVEEESQNVADAVIDLVVGDAKTIKWGDVNDRWNTLASTAVISAIPGLFSMKQTYKNTKKSLYNMSVYKTLLNPELAYKKIDEQVNSKKNKLTKPEGAWKKHIVKKTKQIFDTMNLDGETLTNISGTLLHIVRATEMLKHNPDAKTTAKTGIFSAHQIPLSYGSIAKKTE